MMNNLTKANLQTGDVVISKGGWQGVVLRGTPFGDIIKWFKNEYGEIISRFRSLHTVSEDLSYAHSKIVKVYRSTSPCLLTSCDVIQDKYLIWEDKVKEVTMKELEEMYGCKVKIVNN